MDGYFNFKYTHGDAISDVTLKLWKKGWTLPTTVPVSKGHTDTRELEGYNMIKIKVTTNNERMFSEIDFQFYVSKNPPSQTGTILFICFGSLGAVLIVILIVCLIRRKKRNHIRQNVSRQPLMANQHAYLPQQEYQVNQPFAVQQVTQVTQVQT